MRDADNVGSSLSFHQTIVWHVIHQTIVVRPREEILCSRVTAEINAKIMNMP